MDRTEFADVLERLAEAIEFARPTRDVQDMTPETSFNDALWVVSDAIKNAVRAIQSPFPK